MSLSLIWHIIDTEMQVRVRWQSGITEWHDSRDVRRINLAVEKVILMVAYMIIQPITYQGFVPGEIVQHSALKDSMKKASEYGVIQSVDVSTQTAIVKWGTEEQVLEGVNTERALIDASVSLFELEPLSYMTMTVGDIGIWIGDDRNHGVAFGIALLLDGRIEVEWPDGRRSIEYRGHYDVIDIPSSSQIGSAGIDAHSNASDDDGEIVVDENGKVVIENKAEGDEEGWSTVDEVMTVAQFVSQDRIYIITTG